MFIFCSYLLLVLSAGGLFLWFVRSSMQEVTSLLLCVANNSPSFSLLVVFFFSARLLKHSYVVIFISFSNYGFWVYERFTLNIFPLL